MSEPASAASPSNPARTTRVGTSTRSKARKRALDILFEADLRGVDPLDTLDARTEAADPPVRDYTSELVRGVMAHRSEIDSRIEACISDGWSLRRMPRVDRTAARIAVFEIDHVAIPDAVAISEAVALVSDLSTDDSPAYLSGLLGTIASTKAPAATA
ncbi:MAG: nusB [Friedmanniella sp.]|nr:nusB [Friedmanniella sp.]